MSKLVGIIKTVENTYFTRDDFNNNFGAEMVSANEVFELRKKSGIKDYTLANYDFIFISDRKENLELLGSFLDQNYSCKIREIKKAGKGWELSGDAPQFPVDEDNLLYWALDLYCKGFEFDCILDGYGALADPDLGLPNMGNDMYDYYFNIALEVYNNRNLGMAIIHWSTAIKINSNDPNAWYSRAIAKDELYTWKAARKDYDKAIELAPDFVDAIVNRAANKDEAEEYDEAIKDYTKAIELDPGNAMAYFNRGNSKLNLGDKSGACKDWHKSKELGAEYADERISKMCI